VVDSAAQECIETLTDVVCEKLEAVEKTRQVDADTVIYMLQELENAAPSLTSGDGPAAHEIEARRTPRSKKQKQQQQRQPPSPVTGRLEAARKRKKQVGGKKKKQQQQQQQQQQQRRGRQQKSGGKRAKGGDQADDDGGDGDDDGPPALRPFGEEVHDEMADI
jgi:type IV secretory pathway VirB10-like protein